MGPLRSISAAGITVTPQELQAAFEAFVKNLANAPKGPTVSELIAQYKVAEEHRHKPNGWANIRSALKIIEQEWGDRVAISITYDDIDEFARLRMSRDGVTRFSAELGITRMSTVLSWALQRRKISHNPMAGYKYSGEAGGRDRAYTDDEIDAWLDASRRCDVKLTRAVVVVMRKTGIRPGELIALERPAINRANGLTRLSAKITKNCRERSCVIWPCGLDALDEVAHPESLWALPSPKSPNQPVNKSTIQREWRKVAQVAQLAPNDDGSPPELYAMRGTLATYLGLVVGLNEQQLMAAMGWDDPAQARKYVRTGERQILEQAYRLQGRPLVTGHLLSIPGKRAK